MHKLDKLSFLNKEMSSQPRAHKYATLETSGGCPKEKKSSTIKEEFGAFSIRAAVRPPYGPCWGCKANCEQPEVPGVS